MDPVEQIKQAVEKLSLEERAEFAKWFHGWSDDAWDQQIAQDARHGALDSLLREIDQDIDADRLDQVPAPKGQA